MGAMKHTIAIATAKVRGRLSSSSRQKSGSEPIDVEIGKSGLGLLLLTGALIGTGGVVCLITGLVKSGGPLELLRGWLSALFGG